jgi:glycosyltransferase involved in cell wall biosynthesis
VIEKPGVSDAELATYVHHAQASLFPSFVEGYGLPLMEGLAAGVPVVASDLPVFRELAGEAPIYVDPLDGPGWLARVTELASADARAHAAQRIQGFRAPSWEEHFAKVDALLESLA